MLGIAVNPEDVEGVIVPVPLLDDEGEEPAHDTGGDTEDEGAEGSDETGTRGDGGQAGDGAGGDAEHGSLAGFLDVLDGPDGRGGGGGDLGGDAREGGVSARGERGAAVEAVPAHPEHAGAQHGEHEVARNHLVLLAGAEDGCADERADARGDVHHDATGEVHDALGRHETVGAPDHVAGGEVHGEHPEAAVPHHRVELHALDEGADHERGGDDGEGHLVEGPEGLGDGLPD